MVSRQEDPVFYSLPMRLPTMPEEVCEASNAAGSDGPSPRSSEGGRSTGPVEDAGPRRCRLSRRQVLKGGCAFSMLAVLTVLILAATVIKTPRESAAAETSRLFKNAGHDCVQFADYSEGDVIESDYVIGTSDFTFMAWIKPHMHRYGMILSRDRAGDGAGMFRVPMWPDGRVGMTELAAFAVDGSVEDLEYPSAVDANGWGSNFTSAQPLQLGQEAHFVIVRRGFDWAIFLDGEHAVSGGWRRQNGGLLDLKYFEDKNLRVGSRHPRLPALLSPGSLTVQDPFPGTIRGASLHVGVAFSEEQIRQGGHATCQ